MKALITGIAGFAGSHLTEYLLSQKVGVWGFFHPRHSTDNLNPIRSQISGVPCDILDKNKVLTSIKHIKPDFVFHLAAFSSPSASFANPAETLNNNILGQINLLESLVAIKSKARILVIGSADEYGAVDPKFLPLDENTPLAPNSPYAVSKVTQDFLGWQYFLHHGLHIVRVRPFNHIGPRQAHAFVVASFASQIAQLEKEGGGQIKVGNLENYRDFTDVRDMVRAYLLALEKCTPGEVYNIGSGKPIKIADLLAKMISLSKVVISIKKDPSRRHLHDIKKIYCDFKKFKNQTGWRPKIPLSRTLSDTIEYERRK